jgi:cytidylate kinase
VFIFSVAAPPAAAPRRRAADPAHASSRGLAVAEVATALEARDRIDSTRAASPLTAAPDAVHIDTTGKSIEAVVKEAMGVVERRLKERRT